MWKKILEQIQTREGRHLPVTFWGETGWGEEEGKGMESRRDEENQMEKATVVGQSELHS